MKPEPREEFLTWYEEHKDDEFDFQKEILHYCRLDVDILAQSCIKFRDRIMTVGGYTSL